MWPDPGPGRRAGIYVGLLVAASLAALVLVPGAQPSSDDVYAALGAGLVVGGLLWVRLRPGQPGTTLLLLPALDAELRFGPAALPAVAFASLAASLLRGARGPALLVAPGHTTLAYAAADLTAHAVGGDIPVRFATFALAFALSQFALSRLADLIGGHALRHPRAEQPDPLLTLALAPLAALPLLAAERLGDLGLVLALAALLVMLAMVAEAASLRTARVEAEAERDQLAKANALQRDLVHLITHELKNPLTSVSVYAQLVDRGLSQGAYEKLPAHVDRIRQATAAIQRLIDNLLQLSRLEETGELPPSEVVDVAGLTRAVVADLEPLAEHKRQTLRVEVAEPVPPVMAPPVLLRQALSNLVSNAIKYTPSEGEVRVWARAVDDTGDVALGVSDTGIGLSQADLARLFSKFFRSADPRARQEPGSGLGLALTHTIIRRMGGRIEVESALNVGTTFRIVLPGGQR